MLSEREQQAWNEIERNYRSRSELPAVVVGGGWSAVLLVLFGVPAAGAAVGAAAGLIWLLWRFFPQLDRTLGADTDRDPDHADVGRLETPFRSPARRDPATSPTSDLPGPAPDRDRGS